MRLLILSVTGGITGSEVIAGVTATSDAAGAARVHLVEERLARAEQDGQATDRVHTVDGNRKVYTQERTERQNEIIRALLAAAEEVPANCRAVMVGGIPGAGKTTVLAKHPDIDSARWLELNPDKVKVEMAAREMIPEIQDLSPMEASTLVHDESSWVTDILASRATALMLNVIWDCTMKNEESARWKLTALRAAGYTHVRGIFVEVSPDVAFQRALARYQGKQDVWMADRTGYGGRYIQADELRKIAGNGPVSRCRQTFNALTGDFDQWEVWDNSQDRRPKRLETWP